MELKFPNAEIKKALLVLATIAAVGGCAPHGAIESLPSIDSLISNGISHEQGSVSITAGQRIRVPENARVESGGPEGQCLILVDKALSIYAHPVEKISIEEMRHRMGCVTARSEAELWIGTFGEYELDGHGGTAVGISVRVPEGVEVVKSEQLSGADSLANSEVLRNGSPSVTQGGMTWDVLHTVPRTPGD